MSVFVCCLCLSIIILFPVYNTGLLSRRDWLVLFGL